MGIRKRRSNLDNIGSDVVGQPFHGYLVLSENNTILGVYGEDVRQGAIKQADKIRKGVKELYYRTRVGIPFAKVRVLKITMSKRPEVGDAIEL
jgi:hypothetical protein